MGQKMAGKQIGRAALAFCAAAVLTACGENKEFNLFNKKPGGETEVTSDLENSTTTKLVERDVEVPEVFQASDKGLWDGRPSLGGVWVAHPDVAEPERVIIRNEDNGKFVVGALFKRERDNPGPPIQVSSDAAAALGLLAGAPGALNVTALRRQEVPISGEPPVEPPSVETATLDAPEVIETVALDDPTALAAAALDAAGATKTPDEPELTNVVPTSAPLDDVPVATTIDPASSNLLKPYIQVGLYSVEENAIRNGTNLRKAGILPIINQETHAGKTYWRVLAGPAPTRADRRTMLSKIKNLGYSDAYSVRN